MIESIRSCSECGKQNFNSHQCPLCDFDFCKEHKDPRQHNCIALEKKQIVRHVPKKFNIVKYVLNLIGALSLLGLCLFVLDAYKVINLNSTLFQVITRIKAMATILRSYFE